MRPVRIWLALDSPSRSATSLDAAFGLARELNGEIAAVFVENVDLIRVAGFPGAAETRTFARAQVPLALDELESALRAQALLAERMLGQLALQSGVNWSFRRVRGRMVHQALELAASAECVVLPPVWCSVAIGSRASTTGRRVGGRMPLFQVWAVPGEGPGATRVLEIGHRLMQISGEPGRLVVPRSGAAVQSIRGWLRERGETREWLELPESELVHAATRPRSTENRLLLMPKPADPPEIGRLEETFRRLGWTLLLV